MRTIVTTTHHVIERHLPAGPASTPGLDPAPAATEARTGWFVVGPAAAHLPLVNGKQIDLELLHARVGEPLLFGTSEHTGGLLNLGVVEHLFDVTTDLDVVTCPEAAFPYAPETVPALTGPLPIPAQRRPVDTLTGPRAAQSID